MPDVMAMRSTTQRTLLLSFIISIACCGLVGIYCLLLGSLGWLEGRILATTGAFGAASILGLAAAIPWERRRWHPLGLVAMLSVAAALLMLTLFIWINRLQRGETYLNPMLIMCIAAIALPHVGLLSLARLRKSYEWIRLGAVAAITVLAGLLCWLTIAEPRGDWFFRLIGIVAITDVCGTIAVPILHRISAIQTRESVLTTELKLSLTCPRCSKTQQLSVGRSRCAGCGLRFSIEIEEEHCGNCGYVLYAIQSAVCPECGHPTLTATRTPTG